MAKTISFELSKRLSEWWYLDNIETEYCYIEHFKNIHLLESNDNLVIRFKKDWWTKYKTLTLEEAIDFLPATINRKSIGINKRWGVYNVEYIENYYDMDCYSATWKTLLEAIEKMIEYLLDNNLLPKYLLSNV